MMRTIQGHLTEEETRRVSEREKYPFCIAGQKSVYYGLQESYRF